MNTIKNYQEDTFHHLYNRGAFKKRVFFDIADYKYFQRRLLHYKKKYLIEILCYCLMPNHFHLFVRQSTKENPINKFIGSLINSYTKSINKKYKRTGVLFEGSTKNKIVYDESSFPYLIRYILLNPVRANLCYNFDEYEFSSAKEMLGLTDSFITDSYIANHFKSTNDFKEFMLKDEEYDIESFLEF